MGLLLIFLDFDLTAQTTTNNPLLKRQISAEAANGGQEWFYDVDKVYLFGVPYGYICPGYRSLVNNTEILSYFTSANGAASIYDNSYNYNPFELEAPGRPYGRPIASMTMLDTHGKILWSKNYGHDVSELQNSIQVSDGNIVAIGPTYATDIAYNPGEMPALGTSLNTSSFNNYRKLWVIKTDISGNILWSYIYSNYINQNTNNELERAYKNNSYGWDITETEDGNLLAYGWNKDETQSHPLPQLFLVKINSENGHIIWKTTLYLPFQDLEFTSSAISSKDDLFVIAGNVTNFPYYNQTYNQQQKAFVFLFQGSANPPSYSPDRFKLLNTEAPLTLPGPNDHGINEIATDVHFYKNQQILVAGVKNLTGYGLAGYNYGTGVVWKATYSTSPLKITFIEEYEINDEILAYDLRPDVDPLQDGFIYLSTNETLEGEDLNDSAPFPDNYFQSSSNKFDKRYWFSNTYIAR